MPGRCERNSGMTGGGMPPVAPFGLHPLASRVVPCESIQCSRPKKTQRKFIKAQKAAGKPKHKKPQKNPKKMSHCFWVRHNRNVGAGLTRRIAAKAHLPASREGGGVQGWSWGRIVEEQVDAASQLLTNNVLDDECSLCSQEHGEGGGVTGCAAVVAEGREEWWMAGDGRRRRCRAGGLQEGGRGGGATEARSQRQGREEEEASAPATTPSTSTWARG